MTKNYAQNNILNSDYEDGVDNTRNIKYLEATHVGQLKIGNAAIGCAVLEDGTRLLTQSDIMQVMGKGRPSKPTSLDPNAIPEFLGASNLEPFIPDELRQMWTPIPFRVKGRKTAYGYRADILPHICNVYLDAAEAGELYQGQMGVLRQCQILIRGFATVGIIALIDEATGYQEERDRDALHKILEAYISKELLPWTRRFPDEFYKEMFRLRGWQYPNVAAKGPQGPRYAAQLTNEIVYDRLPPGVLEELQRKNPVVDGRREHKHHQFLTENIGNVHLERHLAIVTALMRASTTWEKFKRLLARAVPKPGETIAIQEEIWPEGDTDQE